MNIPKIIHHIAPSDKSLWHIFWHKCYNSWKEQFPNYQFMLWNDKEDLDNIVKNYYPLYVNMYNAFPVDIMRIDFARLCILHKYGGLYVDMDVFCYKNFEHYLDNEIYFLENLTYEYTDAQWENSMMASSRNHIFIEELMKYSKTCFIHFRRMFNKFSTDWRNMENSRIVNNTTGSGMISQVVKTYSKYFNISSFECELFNNRPMSYDKRFYTKHIHTSIWGTEYINKNIDRLLIIDGSAYSADCNLDIESFRDKNYEIIMNNEFDFYKDYTGGNYFKRQ